MAGCGRPPLTRTRSTASSTTRNATDAAHDRQGAPRAAARHRPHRCSREKGFDATSVEEIAQRAGVSKPVVYEHFGGKEGLYAVVVDREMSALLDAITGALTSSGHPRELLESAAFALLDYVEKLHRRLPHPGARLARRVSRPAPFASLISDAASQVEHIMVNQFKARGFDPSTRRCTRRCWSAWSR